MIQAHDLRIGNWVNYIDGKPIQWEAEDFSNPYMQDISSPIPLSPEILEKANIKYNSTHDWWVISGEYCVQWDSKFWLQRLLGDEDLVTLFELTSLSHLQNAVYFITGTELNIQL